MNNSSIFTLDRQGIGFDLIDYPVSMYVDTSVFNMIFGSQNTSNTKRLLSDFIGDCLDRDVRFYSSAIVHEELAHIIKQDIIRQEFENLSIKIPRYEDGKRNTKAMDDIVIKNNPNIINVINDSVTEAKEFVRQVSEFLPYEESEDITNVMFDLMNKSNYSLDTRDIKHVLAAHTYDINSILTCDGDYAKFDNLNVYVPPSEKYTKLKIGRANVLLPFDKNKY